MAFKWTPKSGQMVWQLGDLVGPDGYLDVRYTTDAGWALWGRGLTDYNYVKLPVPCAGAAPTAAECKEEGERVMRERIAARQERENAAKAKELADKARRLKAQKEGARVFG